MSKSSSYSQQVGNIYDLDMNKVIQPAGREGGRLMHTMV
jgi:hypothetical protein